MELRPPGQRRERPHRGSRRRAVRNDALTGRLNSQTTSRPPGRVTRSELAQRGRGVGDVAQPEGHRHGVERAVGERQPRGVGGDERQVGAAARRPSRSMPSEKSAGTTWTPASAQRLARTCRCRRRCRGPARPGRASTAAIGRGAATGRRRRRSEHVVGDVVPPGDVVEHRGDVAGLSCPGRRGSRGHPRRPGHRSAEGPQRVRAARPLAQMRTRRFSPGTAAPTRATYAVR